MLTKLTPTYTATIAAGGVPEGNSGPELETTGTNPALGGLGFGS